MYLHCRDAVISLGVDVLEEVFVLHHVRIHYRIEIVKQYFCRIQIISVKLAVMLEGFIIRRVPRTVLIIGTYPTAQVYQKI